MTSSVVNKRAAKYFGSACVVSGSKSSSAETSSPKRFVTAVISTSNAFVSVVMGSLGLATSFDVYATDSFSFFAETHLVRKSAALNLSGTCTILTSPAAACPWSVA